MKKVLFYLTFTIVAVTIGIGIGAVANFYLNEKSATTNMDRATIATENSKKQVNSSATVIPDIKMAEE